MKKITLLVFLIFIFSCKNEDFKSFHFTEKNEIEKINLTFPELSNWKECYSNPKVKKRFNEFTLPGGTSILGVYLQNDMELLKDQIDSLDLENYAVFMYKEKDQKWKIKNSDFKNIFETQKRDKNIKSINKEKALKNAFKDSTFLNSEKPIVIEEYRSSENVFTAIMLTKPYFDDHNYIIVFSYNIINIKNHLFYCGYYLPFDGNESIDEIKKNSKRIISEFVKLNNK